MNSAREQPPRLGGTGRSRARSIVLGCLVALVVGLMVASTLQGATVRTPESAPATPAASPAALPSATHGDLVVPDHDTFTIEPPSGSGTYYQGGNITVQAGGTLVLENVTLSFVEFVGASGTPQQRLSHIYHFVDDGTVRAYASTITTDLVTLSTYAKLNLTVGGVMTLYNSTLAFAGWVSASGAGANLTLYNSSVKGNPQFPGLLGLPQTGINKTIVGDGGYAPTLNVSAGGQASLFHSSYEGTYADNLSANGTPEPPALTNTSTEALIAGTNITHFDTPTDTANVTLDALYANEIDGGTVTVNYTATVGGTATAELDYGGAAYGLGSVTLAAGTGVAVYAFPALLTKAIDTQGVVAFLNYTGDFGVTPGKIALDFTAVGATGATATGVSIQLTPNFGYNLTVTGAGSKLSTVDTQLDISFVDIASAPWDTHQLALTDGATAFLGNLTSPNPVPKSHASPGIVADATSTATLFRWASFNLTGSGGVLQVVGGKATAYYAYNTTEANNLTVNGDNAFGTSDPSIAGYLDKVWDKAHDRPGYGESGREGGVASLLLATNQISGSSVPDGDFLGDYEIVVTAPTSTNTTATQTFVWGGVNPYPEGVARNTSGYNATNYGPALNFPLYTVGLNLLGIEVEANGVPDSTVKVGQVLDAVVTVQDVGAGPITYLSAILYYNTSAATIVASVAGPVNLTIVDQEYHFTLSWLVATSVTGHHTGSFTNTFWLVLEWNQDLATEGGSSSGHEFTATIAPASTSPSAFLFEKLVGLPIWLWIAIAAIIVGGLLGALYYFRRRAGGKLVECGECGNLIPEEATVCPKCGAEFEADVVRCSRCASTIPASSKFCPECAVQLLGTPGQEALDPERQAYADFTERYRAEAKKALGENYTEGAFWDWWKRQTTYTPYGQWRLQQGQGTPRTRMTAPPPGSAGPGGPAAPARGTPPKGAAPARPGPRAPPPAAAPAAPPAEEAAPVTAPAAAASAGGNLKACPNCSKEIPAEYLVCPFCGSVTQ